ncbi:hypothetical protein WA538_002911 [Blastocystis sp. DL]
MFTLLQKNAYCNILVPSVHTSTESYQKLLHVSFDSEQKEPVIIPSDPIYTSSRIICSSSVSDGVRATIYSGMADGSVLATQVENESTKQSTICFHQTLPVSSVSIDKYSSCLIAAYPDGSVHLDSSSSFYPQYGCNKVYSLGGGELAVLSSATQHSFTHYVNQQPVLSIGCKESGTHFTCMTMNESSPNEIVLGCSDGTIEGYDIRNTERELYSYKNHTAAITSLSLVPGGVVSSSLDGCVLRKDGNGNVMRLLGDWSPITSCIVGNDSKWIVAGGRTGNLFVIYF